MARGAITELREVRTASYEGRITLGHEWRILASELITYEGNPHRCNKCCNGAPNPA
jgi:hypothetical protein